MSRNRTMRAAVSVFVLAGWAAAAGGAEARQTFWRDSEWAVLQREIPVGKAERKRIGDQAFEQASLFFDTDRDPLDVVVRRSAALLEHLQRTPGGKPLTDEAKQLAALKARARLIDVADIVARKAAFDRAAELRRRIAFANPLLNFDKILFIKRHFMPNSEKTGNHMCDQYFGFHAIAGGGLFVLEKPLSGNPTVRNVLAGAICENGRFKGRSLGAGGGYLSPELSFDGKEILFSYTDIPEPRKRYTWTPENCWHVFKVNVDGTHLRQLTDGPWNDFDPAWLPNGDIAFISERRGGYGRCHGRPVPSFTLHRMKADGGDIACLSPHETNEWQPSIANDGKVLYTRWDYVDRGFNQAHHPWLTTPDGRDSRVVQGNFAASAGVRPHMEIGCRAIPGSRKLVATAACHHGQAYGSLVLVDPDVEDDDAMGAVRRLTPEQRFPESENRVHRDPVNYAGPWPLSEHFFLAVYDPNSHSNTGTSNNYGIYLVDAFGNKELLYRDEAISCLDPIPLRPRPRPPIIPDEVGASRPTGQVCKETGAPPPKPPLAEVAVMDVYNARLPWPADTRIAALRIIQLLPKTTPYANNPRIGYGDQKSARAVLGTVPVEADGSAYFRMPVNRPVYFQALDANGLAVQSMRSATYVHPGEKLTCKGCHDRPTQSPPIAGNVLALRRGPSKIDPEAEGSNPFSFPRLVQPVLDKHCVGCHDGKKVDTAGRPKGPDLRAGDPAKNPGHFHTSYVNLRKYAFYFNNAVYTTPRTIPGQFGARASTLYRMLAKGHNKVQLSRQEMRRITLWLDCNSDFFGAYDDIAAQARGEIIRPRLE